MDTTPTTQPTADWHDFYVEPYPGRKGNERIQETCGACGAPESARRPPTSQTARAGRTARTMPPLTPAASPIPAEYLADFRIKSSALIADLERASDGGTRLHALVPALHVGVVLQVLALLLVRDEPGVDRHICDRVLLAGEVLGLGESPEPHDPRLGVGPDVRAR